MTLQAYIDDSASEQGEKTFVLAGYVQSVSNWAVFSDDWGGALKTAPSINYLHMVEAQNRRDEFSNWTAEDRDKKLVKLGEVIRRHQPWSIQCSVSKRDYNQILKPAAPYNLHSPYFACFYGVVLSLARYHKSKGLTVPVDFVFDEQGSVGIDAVVWYEYIKAMHPGFNELLGSTPVFRDDKKVYPLQAADMLAWHMRRIAERRESGKELAAIGYLRGDGTHVMVEITKDVLIKWANDFSKVEGVDLVKDKRSWRATRPEIIRRLALGLGPPIVRVNIFRRLSKLFSTFFRARLFRSRDGRR